MKTSDFYYDLPKELIAQDPLEDRSASRLMHLNKETGEYEHGHFRDILKYLKPGDCLVINDTKVIPARLYGSKVGTDAAIEILLLKRRENDIWETLVKPGDGKPLIKEINIQLNKGEILTLIGPNGAGKSTILKSITRQLSLIGGTVYLEQEQMSRMTNKEVSRKLAVVLTERMRPELKTSSI